MHGSAIRRSEAELLVTPDAKLAISASDLAQVLRASGRQDLVVRGKLESAAGSHVPLDQLRDRGIDLRYDPLADKVQLVLSDASPRPAPSLHSLSPR
jgi:hypothetical protein